MDLNKVTADVVDILEVSTALRALTAAGGVMDYANTASSTIYNHTSHLDVATIGTTSCNDTAMIMDVSGNIYWSIVSDIGGSSYCKLYKISPKGEILYTFTHAVNGSTSTALATDGSHIYWAVCNYSYVSSLPATSKVYRHTPSGSTTGTTNVYYTATMPGSYGTSLAYVNGSLYWALSYFITSAGANGECRVYKLTGINGSTFLAASSSLHAKATGHSAARTKLLGVGTNVFWSNANSYNGTTSALSCQIYNITTASASTEPPAILCTRALVNTMDVSMIYKGGYIYWAVAGGCESPVTTQNVCYVYKVRVSDGAIGTPYATRWYDHAISTDIAIDTNDVLYWALCGAVDNTNSNDTLVRVFVVDPIDKRVVPITHRPGSAPTTVRIALNAAVSDSSVGLEIDDLYMAVAQGGWGEPLSATNTTLSRFNRIIQD